MTLRDVEEKITKHLKKRFNERDKKDFYFKSSDLPLTIDNRVIGRVLEHHIAPKGIIKLWSIRRHSVNVWKTCFNGGL